MAGCFDGISGMILGSFENCGEIDQIFGIFQDIFSDTQWPILAGFNIGHGFPNFTIPFGIDALLDTESGALKFQYPHLEFKK
jgi:muramoyltetrapeptide carboxypeptidase